MHYLAFLGAAAGLFLAMPWLAIAFNRYCNAVNRLLAKHNRKEH